MDKKWASKLLLGLAGLAMTGGAGGCTGMTVRTVVTAKGTNRLRLSDIDNSDAHYVLNCRTFKAGARLYRNTSLGDTITGTYVAPRNCICLTVSPDTVARYFINCDELEKYYAPDDQTEDEIIRGMVRPQKQR